MKPQLLTVDEIAALVADDPNNIQQFVIDDRIPYIVHEGGILIPLGGFQVCMNDLYDLFGTLEALNKMPPLTDEQITAIMDGFRDEESDV